MPARKTAARPRKVKAAEPAPAEPESKPAEPAPPLTAEEAKLVEQTPGQVEDLEKDLAAMALPQTCTRCKVEKPLDAFPLGARKVHLKICIDCRATQAAKASKDTPSPIGEEGPDAIATQAE